jgi:hypothetical protein
MKTKIRATITAACTAGLLSIATPAFAAGAILDVGDGTLLAKGAGATIPITFVCDAGQTYLIDLGVQQRVSQGRVAKGGTQTFGDCTGSEQTITLTVTSDGDSNLAFKSGSALARVFFETCGIDFCDRFSADYEIALKNK